MGEEEWRSRLVQVVAQQVRRRRLELGLSVQKLADICAEDYGLPIKRSVLANFEGGRRPALSVVELLVLARILAIPPVELLFPVGRVDQVEVLPDTPVDAWDALRWFTGERDSLPTDSGKSQETAAVQWHREHEQLVETWWIQRRELEASLSGGDGSLSDDVSRRLLELKEQALRGTESAIKLLRSHMLRVGLAPPELGEITKYIATDTPPDQASPEPKEGGPH
ncbi:helix-turn-helix domain-containing protein [Streptomyces canus]